MPGARICLGLESSCDETAAALVDGERRILSSVVFGQADMHAPFGGVVPEIAARAHAERLDVCVAEALVQAGLQPSAIDAIAVTAGPGLMGGLLSGVLFAKGLAAGLACPLWPVNHLAGHALTPRLTDGIAFPYLMLLISGGHCQFLAVEGPAAYRRLGSTRDDAPGEAFDKVARLLGLGFPGGPAVEQLATAGDPTRFALPRPLLDQPGIDMSFSGLKTALRRTRDELVLAQGGLWHRDRQDLAAGFQAAVADVLGEKTRRALAVFEAEYAPAAPVLAVAGGVAANRALGAALHAVAKTAGFAALVAPLALATDNAAMIAWAGLEQAAEMADAPLIARPRWPLDTAAAPMVGSGRKGAKA